MRKMQLAMLSIFLLLAISSATAEDQNVRWRQIVGIILPGNVVGSGTGAITGGGFPWTTTGGVAHINLQNGEIQFVVRGLVLAAGNAIGTRGPITAVKGTLICDTDGSAGGGNSTVVETPSVPLSATGDAQFSGSVGSLPAVCSTQPDLAFLVRVSGVNGVAVEGPWIANGAVLVRADDDGQ
jgi:hypothetical protein